MAVLDAKQSKIPCLLNRRIDNGRFLLTHILGSGGCSVVYRATDLPPHYGNVAVKCVLYDTLARKLKMRREIALHRRASSKLSGVARIYHTVEENGLLFMILEYCPAGDLFAAITEAKLFLGKDILLKATFTQLLDTVHGLHGMGIFHRDLKPENVLCADNGSKLLLTDFGLATESEHSESFGCGSYLYMTPECLAGVYTSAIGAYSSRAADIWALGIILINLICSRSPWKAAMLSDPSFFRYTRYSGWLQHILPISTPVRHFLERIFENHGNNLSLADLREQFQLIDTFYMSKMEVSRASKTVRLIASSWLPEVYPKDLYCEGIQQMRHIDHVTESELFDDNVQCCSNSWKDVEPDTDMICGSPECESCNADSDSDSESLVTPETRPIQPAGLELASVPELSLGEQLLASSRFDIPSTKTVGSGAMGITVFPLYSS